MRIVLTAAMVAAAIHAAAWSLTDRSANPADVENPISYVSYSPYLKGQDPRTHRQIIPAEQIEADLSAIADVAQGVRTYSVVDGIDQVPAIANKLGLNVMLGAWVGDTEERDKFEMETVVQLARQHRNVKAVLVGNEVLMRGERTRRRADRADPEGQEAGPRAGFDRRNLVTSGWKIRSWSAPSTSSRCTSCRTGKASRRIRRSRTRWIRSSC